MVHSFKPLSFFSVHRIQRRLFFVISFSFLLILSLSSLGLWHIVRAQTQTPCQQSKESDEVSTPDDSAAGSLRYLLNNANDAQGDVQITFQDSLFSSGQIIHLKSPLPPIQNRNGCQITINGWSAGGTTYKGVPRIEVNGSNITSPNANGLIILSAGNVVYGLAFTGFSGDVLVIQGKDAHDNKIYSNYVGPGIDGKVSHSNGGNGIAIRDGSANNIIGYQNDSANAPNPTGLQANLILGNAQGGVLLTDTNTATNTIAGNYIGVSPDGTATPNTPYGILITNGALNNIIGSQSDVALPDAAHNYIMGNQGDGIVISGAGTQHNQVANNYIGYASISKDRQAIQNTGYGVLIENGATQNVIGSDGSVSKSGRGALVNTIANNGKDGVRITGAGTDGNVISGNYIGTDQTGQRAASNTLNGITVIDGPTKTRVGADGNASDAPKRNIISGNLGDGIVIQNASGNFVAGNLIGTALGGKLPALGNSGNGITITGQSKQNIIGSSPQDTASLKRNIISGNSVNGILIKGQSSQNTIAGNYIGTDIDGILAVKNQHDGILISDGSASNQIGLTGSVTRNLISGNGEEGVHITDQNTDQNIVAGNYIGTNASGTGSIANNDTGVKIEAEAKQNIIGADGLAAASNGAKGLNVISGNAFYGVWLSKHVSLNIVGGNDIGTSYLGNSAVPNGSGGVRVDLGAFDNVIGVDIVLVKHNQGDGLAGRNTISGNNGPGIVVSAAGNDISGKSILTTNTIIAGNIIGLSAAGKDKLGNQIAGIKLEAGSTQTTIGTRGGPEASEMERNIISANLGKGADPSSQVNIQGNGVMISGSDQNVVAGNIVGLDITGTALVGNAGCGVFINENAQNNRIGTDGNGAADALERNIISGNSGDGIYIFQANNNQVFGNQIGSTILARPIGGNVRAGVHLGNGAQLNVIGSKDAVKANQLRYNQNGVVLQGNDAGTVSNTIEGNIITDNQVNGIFAQRTADDLIVAQDSTHTPNVILTNIIADNNANGILNQGASPAVDGNTIINNALSGIFNTPDYGEPNGNPASAANDRLARPTIGGSIPNQIRGNCVVQLTDCAGIYSLDTKPANSDKLEQQNPAQINNDGNFIEQRWFVVVSLNLAPPQYPPSKPIITLNSANGVGFDIRQGAQCGSVFNNIAIFSAQTADFRTKLSCDSVKTWMKLAEFVVTDTGVRIFYTPYKMSNGQTFDVSGKASSACQPAFDGTGLCLAATMRYQVLSVQKP